MRWRQILVSNFLSLSVSLAQDIKLLTPRSHTHTAPLYKHTPTCILTHTHTHSSTVYTYCNMHTYTHAHTQNKQNCQNLHTSSLSGRFYSLFVMSKRKRKREGEQEREKTMLL